MNVIRFFNSTCKNCFISFRYYRKFINKPNSNIKISGNKGVPKNVINISKILTGEETDPNRFADVNQIDAIENDENDSKNIKAIITQKKLLGKKPVMNILTQKAKEQMFFLHNKMKFSVDDLVEHFPSTHKSCEFIVSKPLPVLSLADLIKFNEIIINRLIAIKSLSIKKKLDNYYEFLWIVEENKYDLIQYANGNDKLEFPEKSMLQLHDDYEARRIPGQMETLYNFTVVGKSFNYLPNSQNKESILEKQNDQLEKLILYFRPESDIIKERLNDKKIIKVIPKQLPNIANIDYSYLFKYKINSYLFIVKNDLSFFCNILSNLAYLEFNIFELIARMKFNEPINVRIQK